MQFIQLTEFKTEEPVCIAISQISMIGRRKHYGDYDGKLRERDVTYIQLANGHGIYVEESVEEAMDTIRYKPL